MFGDDRHDSIIQRGINEALACQDMLERVPVTPSLLTQAIARLCAGVHATTRRRTHPSHLHAIGHSGDKHLQHHES